MRGRQGDAAWMYKRVPLKENASLNKDDFSGNLPNGADKEIRNPSWTRPLPHVLVAAMSSFLFGYHLGIVNETLETIASDLGFKGNTMAEGLVVSTCLGGALIGSIFSGWITDGVGRRRTFQLCALLMIIGASMSAITSNLWGMLLGRLFVGTGMGIGPLVAALYVAEVSPTAVRGAFGSLTQLATCLGLLVTLLIGLPSKETEAWWRICFWISVIPAVALVILMEFCAESPHWHFKRGRAAEAEAAFERLLGAPHVKSAMLELSKVDRGDETEAVKLAELFRGRHSGVVFIGAVLFALQQLSGINAIFYFSSSVFERAGMPAARGNICVGLVNLLGSVFAMILMDKLGRKVLLLGSFTGMAVAMFIQAIAASSFISRTAAMYMSVCSILLVVLTFALGVGPVPSLLLSEIFPSRIKAKAMSFGMAVHWVVNFFVGLLFLELVEKMGAQLIYASFGIFCIIGVVFVKRKVIETAGKTLQEIEMALLPLPL